MNARKNRRRVALAILIGLAVLGGFLLLTRTRHPQASPVDSSARATVAAPTVSEPAKPTPHEATVAPTPAPAPVAAAPLPVNRTPPPARVAASPVAVARPAPVSLQPPATPPPPAADATSTDREVIATRRMYLAHAPLRTPEVSDPDSAGNRKVLSSMIFKALSRAKTIPPGSTASH